MNLRELDIPEPMQKVDMDTVIRIADEAGRKILEVYSREDLFVEYKDDKSPLTMADRLSHEHISSELKRLYPDIPIISEEQKDIPWEDRKDWDYFWLVDPLDGTKEFIKRNGEFTVNIALILDKKPFLGVIYVPVKNEFYYAVRGEGAYKIDKNGNREKIPQKRTLPEGEIKVVASRSHKSKEVEEYVEQLKKIFPEVDYVSSGSSLKLCLVGEGKAHIYPRLGPTMEWDTGAGQIIAEEAGGVVEDYETKKEMEYNKKILRNNFFIVYDSPELKQRLSEI